MATCIFCDREATLTKEHALPLWLKDVLPEVGPFYHRRGQPDEGGPTWTWTDDWTTSKPDFKVKAVCLPCNSRWLSDLEKAAKRVMTPMIQGQRTILDKQQAGLVALWAAKTALVFDALDPPHLRLAPPEHARELHDTRKPPKGTRVWAGVTDDGTGAMRRSFGIRLEDALPGTGPLDPKRGYANTLVVGHLVLFVLRSPLDYREVPKVRGKLAPALVQLWPARVLTAWPPLALIPFRATYFLAEAFMRSI